MKQLHKLEQLIRQAKWAEAQTYGESCRKQLTKKALFHGLMGICYGSLGLHHKAVEALREATKIEPRDPHYWNNLGLTFSTLGDNPAAVDSYQRAIKLDRNFIEPVANCAAAMINLGMLDDVIDLLEDRISTNHRVLMLNLVEAYSQKQLTAKIAPLITRMYSAYPNDRDVLAKVVNAAEQIGDFSLAADAGMNYLAVANQTDDVEALVTISYLHGRCGKIERALELAEQALQLDPNHGYAHYNAALNCLKLGKYNEAWRHHQWRFVPKGSDYQYHPLKTEGLLTKPADMGPMNFYGKKVLFSYEQGIGDELFFLRFLKPLAKLGASISYLPSEKSRPVVEYCSQLDILQIGEQLPEFDYIFPIGEAPLFATTLGVNSYVEPIAFDSAKVEACALDERLAGAPRPWIGVTWRAGMDAKYNQQRIVDMQQLWDSLPHSCGTLVLLQRNITGQERQLLNELPGNTVDLSDLNEDLAALVPVIYQLDDYVGVHNTNMHIRASCHKKAQLLNAYPGDTFIAQEASHSGWFKDFQVYSETAKDGWQSALKALKAQLYGASEA